MSRTFTCRLSTPRATSGVAPRTRYCGQRGNGSRHKYVGSPSARAPDQLRETMDCRGSKAGGRQQEGQPIFAGACSIENGTKHSSATKRLQARAIFLRIVGMNSVRSPRVHDENHANGQAQETHGRGNCRFRFAMKVYGFGDRVHFDGQVRIENACIPPKAMPDAP